MLAHPRELGLVAPVRGQLDHPLAGGVDQLAGDRDEAAPDRLGALPHAPAQRLPLVEHEQVVGQDLQLQVGPFAPKALVEIRSIPKSSLSSWIVLSTSARLA